MRFIILSLFAACAWQEAPPQPGAQTTVEYEYRGRVASRERLQRFDDRAWKRFQERTSE